MITISVCMIVKNESEILARCLDSLKGIWDELIIVDTGSTDNTMEIAKAYTDKVFSFEWTGDFSEARNYALDKATCEYIYTADADEILEGENVDLFKGLKSCLDPKVDVVQMYYGNQLDQGTVYNFDKELRPKLFKRVRPIRFMEPIHETLDLDPIIVDSDIVITHKPTSQHASRDLGAFRKIISNGGKLSKRLQSFYDRELYMQGSEDDWEFSEDYLKSVVGDPDRTTEEVIEACTLLTHLYRVKGDVAAMFDHAVKVIAMESNSEVCDELGAYYLGLGRLDDAAIWYYNAWHETEPILSIKASGEIALQGLITVYEALGDEDSVAFYKQQL